MRPLHRCLRFLITKQPTRRPKMEDTRSPSPGMAVLPALKHDEGDPTRPKAHGGDDTTPIPSLSQQRHCPVSKRPPKWGETAWLGA
jgi:hypothetical protein